MWETWGQGISTYEAYNTNIEDNISYNNQQNIYISDTKYTLVQRNLIYCTPNNLVGSYVLQNGILLGDEKYNPPSSDIDRVMPRSRSTCEAKRASTLAGDMPCRRSVPVRSRKASSIDKRLDLRREIEHGAAHGAADLGVFRHVGPDHRGVRAAAERLEHRHGRADAVGARNVAGGRDHAALAPADNHRLVDERRVVALLDRRIEGVAIDMGDGERAERAVAHEPRRAARSAARGGRRRIGEAVAAEAHDSLKVSHAPRRAAERGMGARDIARVEPGLGGESGDQAVVGGEVVEDAEQEAGGGAGRPNLARREAGCIKETGKPLRFPGQEGKRLNGHALLLLLALT